MQDDKAKGIMVPFEGFRAEFESRVTSIGHLLAMMAPWDCPVYVTRVRASIGTCAELCCHFAASVLIALPVLVSILTASSYTLAVLNVAL